MSKGKIIFAFVSGAALGSVFTWQYVRKKEEQRADEEIASVKEHFTVPRDISNSEKSAGVDSEETIDISAKETKKNLEKPNIINYTKTLTENGYTDYQNIKKAKENIITNEPRVISPDEFGEIEEYDKIELMYYADGVLCDDNDDPVDDPDETVGEDFASHFGEFDDDAVYIRDDQEEADYEILRSEKTYREVLAREPKTIHMEE